MKKVNLVILASFSSSMAFAAGFALYEGSARGNALGGGLMGKAVDASANFYNPATLSDLTNTVVTVGMTTEHPTADMYVDGHSSRKMDPGAFVLPPEYGILSEGTGGYAGGMDHGVFYVRNGWEPGAKCGFFDIPSGFFSGLIYDDVTVLWGSDQDPELIGVTLERKTGFARRQTGEIVIPCRYSNEYQYDFSGDHCMVMPIDSPVADGWILIDRTGREIPMPENCYAAWDGDFADGLAAVWNAETDRYGYIDAEGRQVIGQQYRMAYGFREGLACVQLISGEWAMIDTGGSIVMMRPDEPYSYGSSPCCQHGLIRCGLPDRSAMVYYDRQGREAFRLEVEGLIGVTDFKANGVAFYEVDPDHLQGSSPEAG